MASCILGLRVLYILLKLNVLILFSFLYHLLCPCSLGLSDSLQRLLLNLLVQLFQAVHYRSWIALRKKKTHYPPVLWWSTILFTGHSLFYQHFLSSLLACPSESFDNVGFMVGDAKYKRGVLFIKVWKLLNQISPIAALPPSFVLKTSLNRKCKSVSHGKKMGRCYIASMWLPPKGVILTILWLSQPGTYFLNPAHR